MLEAAAALEGIKAAVELAKALVDGNASTKVQTASIDLNRQLIEAHRHVVAAIQTEATLVKRVADLEGQLAETKRFVADAGRYPLAQVGTGAFAHVGRPMDDASCPEVWLCAPCFRRHQGEILQLEGRTPDRSNSIYGCPACKARIQVHYTQRPNKSRPETT